MPELRARVTANFTQSRMAASLTWHIRQMSPASTFCATRTRRVDTIQGEFVAIDTALERLQPGDLCLVLIDQVEEALRYLRERCDEVSATATATAAA